MLTWRGLGFLVFVLPLAIGVALLVIRSAFFDYQTEQTDRVINVVTQMLSAPLLWIIGSRLNRKPEVLFVDKETGEEVTITERRSHSFFFIKMQYWALLYIVLAGYALAELLHHAVIEQPK